MAFKLYMLLQEELQKVSYKEETKDAPHVQDRCETAWQLIETIVKAFKTNAPNIEQLKGIRRGFELASEIAASFKVVIQKQAKDEIISKEEFREKAEIIDGIVRALKEGEIKQKEELIKDAGKLEGLYAAAMEIVQQINTYVENLKRQEKFIKQNPEAFHVESEKNNGEKKKKLSEADRKKRVKQARAKASTKRN